MGECHHDVSQINCSLWLSSSVLSNKEYNKNRAQKNPVLMQSLSGPPSAEGVILDMCMYICAYVCIYIYIHTHIVNILPTVLSLASLSQENSNLLPSFCLETGDKGLLWAPLPNSRSSDSHF